MSWVTKRYSDISPVTLQVVGGAMSSSLFCGEVEGLSLVESFLVELYRCKVCQFTCGLKSAISSHLLLRHGPPTLTCLMGSDGRGGAEGGLQEAESPYQLDLNGESKQRDEDEEFLLYNMLDNMSPPSCDISTEGGLQVAHTCEVSTLFEEEDGEDESSILPLKGTVVDLSCPIIPSSTQEEMEQSAHLMTLGLCRISAVKPTAPLPSAEPLPLQRSGMDRHTEAPPSTRCRLLCLLCPLILPSKQLLDVHVRSHRAAGGFHCIHCSWTADSWEELEDHWVSHSRRRRRRRRRRGEGQEQQEEDEEEKSRRIRTNRKSASQGSSDRWEEQLFGPESKEVELPDRSIPSTSQTGSSQSVFRMKNMFIRKQSDEEAKSRHHLSCSQCHRKFSTKLTLKRHLGVHGGEKPFSCPHCSYSSRLKASLLQHLRTHTGEKPFRCSECSYASIDRSSLLRHRRTHSQEKPYRCHLCDYRSIQKKSLDLHARRHHTGEAFPCQHCDYSNPDRQLLFKHVRKRHAPFQNAVL